MKPEIELLNHLNICLEYFNENKGDNLDPVGFVGAKYLFKFPNNLVLSFISADEVYLYCSDHTLELNLPKTDWTFVKEADAWESQIHFSPEYLIDAIEQFSKHYGAATLILPWREWLERYGPLSEEWEGYEENFEEEDQYEDLEILRNAKNSQLNIEGMLSLKKHNFIFETPSDFESGDTYLPLNSQFSRLQKYYSELQNRGWLIIDYMSDHEFSFDRLQEERDEGSGEYVAPGLVSPLEHVSQCYRASGVLDGWIGIIDIGDGNLDDLNCAKDFGLKFEIRHENQLTVLPD